MKQSDLSIRNITIAAIKRHTIPPIKFEYSNIYENEDSINHEKIKNKVKLKEEEKLICSTVVNELIWSILTTRRIITLEGISRVEHNLKGLIQRNAGDFKGWSKQKYTKGFLHFNDNKIIPYFIETGKASMIMVYGIDTITKLNT